MTYCLENVSVIRSGNSILNDASLTCHAGNFTAFCGANGAGKTTALSSLAGMLKADRGNVFLDGNLLSSYDQAKLARRRAVVAQQSLLTFPFQVHEVIAMGRAPHQGKTSVDQNRKIIGAVINLMELQDLAERVYTTLSGGERQRVQIARALVQVWEAPDQDSTRWLLLDEPTSALDLKYKIALMRLLKSLAHEGWGIIAVLHDIHLIKKHADAVVLFKNGNIVAAGAVAETLTDATIEDVFDLDEPYSV